MITINMLSKADSVKGQGVLSAHDEQVDLIKEMSNYSVSENKFKCCDIMHYHTINFQYLLTIPFAKLRGKAVGYVHFLPETLEGSLKLQPIIKRAFYRYVISFYKAMDYLVVVNPYFIDVLEQYGIDREKITYIPNFVSSKQFYPVEKSQKPELRSQYNLKQDAFTVLCVGQLQTRKGVVDFIEVAKKLPNMQFIWAGDIVFGKISNGYEEIKKVLQNPPENVKFLGLIEREKMNELYNLADVMFLPSYEELFPMTVLEAMNCRIPILLRDIELYKNILFDFYLKGKTNDEFSDVLKKLESDKNYYQESAESSWKGHEFYSKDHVAMMWDEFYSEIIEKVPLIWKSTKSIQQKS